MTNQTNVRDYETAAAYLEQGRDKEDRPLEYATRLQRRNENKIAVRLHETDVVTYHADGSVTLNSRDPDGTAWRTQTTKDRLNGYQDLAWVIQEDGVWYVKTGTHRPTWDTEGAEPFSDGMRIYPDGTVEHREPVREPDYVAELSRAVSAYAREFAEAALDLDLEGLDGHPEGTWDDYEKTEKTVKEKRFDLGVLLDAVETQPVSSLYRSWLYDIRSGKGVPDAWARSFKRETRRILRAHLKRQLEIAR